MCGSPIIKILKRRYLNEQEKSKTHCCYDMRVCTYGKYAMRMQAGGYCAA